MEAPPEEENAYLALRAAKIARNEARMRELGLLPPRKRDVALLEPQRQERPASSSSRKRKTEDSLLPRRRSSRLQGGGESVSHVDAPLESVRKSGRNRTGSDNSEKEVAAPSRESPRSVLTEPRRVSTFPSNSARAMSLNVEQLVHGGRSTDEDGLLGVPMERAGKAFVMEESARRAVETYLGGSISFNKYSGLQEWGNDVLYLWINLKAPNCTVINEFLEQGQCITWFGGAKMHDQTASILKLVRVGRAAEKNSAGGVVLWCREYDPERKTFGPYLCFGRLSLVSYDPTSRPLAFVWKLLDYDGLSAHQNKMVRDTFQAMIQV